MRRTRGLYPPHSEGDVIRIPWQEQDYKVQCCDCGLIHRYRFRMEGAILLMRVWRDNRATGQIRRHKSTERDRELIARGMRLFQTALINWHGREADTAEAEGRGCHSPCFDMWTPADVYKEAEAAIIYLTQHGRVE